MLVEVPHNTVMQGHVLDKLKELPNDCVDVIVTSTPYYGLRDYGPDCVSVWGGKADCEHEWETELTSRPNSNGGQSDKQETVRGSHIVDYDNRVTKSNYCSKCGAWKGQLGLEPHPSMFIEHLAQVFLEIKRVLKPSGSLWLNLGDTYFGGNGQYGRPEGWKDLENSKLSAHAPGEFSKELKKLRSNWLQPKQKMLIPARVAIALQDQGWILRNEIVWHKVNHMPESCRDRLTRSWESVYFFTKNDRYYFDLDAIRKPHEEVSIKRVDRAIGNSHKYGSLAAGNDGINRSRPNRKTKIPVEQAEIFGSPRARYHRKDTNMAISSYQFADGDYLVQNLNPKGANPGDVWTLTNEGLKDEHFAAFPQKLVKRILECSAPKNGLILDPFAGSGTSLLVAHKMGFDWLGIELVPKYCKIIEKRIERHGKIRLDGFMVSNSSVLQDKEGSK
jgi:DNA modification methylase